MRTGVVAAMALLAGCREPLDVPEESDGDGPVIADAGHGTSIVVTNAATLDASQSQSFDTKIHSYLWELSSGPDVFIDDDTAEVTSAHLFEVGAYTFHLTVVDGGGFTSTSDVTFESIPPQVTLSIDAPASAPANSFVELTGNLTTVPDTVLDSTGLITSIVWSSNPKLEIFGPNQLDTELRSQRSGQFELTLEVGFAWGQTVTANATIQVTGE